MAVTAAADWGTLRTPETYLSYERAENFASPGGEVPGKAHGYTAPARLLLNQWALSGDLDDGRPGGHAERGRRADRMPVPRPRPQPGHGAAGPAAAVPFRVLLDGQPPGTAHGIDVDDLGNGMAREQRLYQLIRQHGPITDHTFEIIFPEPRRAGLRVHVRLAQPPMDTARRRLNQRSRLDEPSARGIPANAMTRSRLGETYRPWPP